MSKKKNEDKSVFVCSEKTEEEEEEDLGNGMKFFLLICLHNKRLRSLGSDTCQLEKSCLCASLLGFMAHKRSLCNFVIGG